jgi:hypothetical protein
VLGRLGHAAALHDRDEHVQVAQLEAPTDLAFPVDFPGHAADGPLPRQKYLKLMQIGDFQL